MARRDTAGQAAAEAAADELYGLPLDEFTAARNERAKQARAQGDRDAAAVIGKLAKPNAVAWLANQLARQRAGDLRQLLELGDSMRQATAALDAGELRQLSAQQRQVVGALVREAQVLADAAGQALSGTTTRGLEDTLHAALADGDAAAQLSAGRLTAGLSRSGFPGAGAVAGNAAAVATAAALRAPPGTGAGTGTVTGDAAASRDAGQARQAEADAQRAAASAARGRDQAHAALKAAQEAARAAMTTVTRLAAELEAARAARSAADRTARAAQRDADLADRAVRQAERRLADAAARRKSLER